MKFIDKVANKKTVTKDIISFSFFGKLIIKDVVKFLLENGFQKESLE